MFYAGLPLAGVHHEKFFSSHALYQRIHHALTRLDLEAIVKRILSLATGVVLLAAGISSIEAQDSQFEIETIPLESVGFGMELSPDDQTLAVYENFVLLGSNEPRADELPIDLIDIETNETIGSLSGYTDWVTDVAFSPDGQRLVSFHRNGHLNVWDVANLSLTKTIRTYSLGGSSIQLLADGKTAVFRSGDFLIAMLDTETEAITRLFGPDIETFDEFSESYSQFPGRGDIGLAAIAASPDGQWLARSSQNDEVTLIHIESRDEWTVREKSEDFGRLAVRPLYFSQDGSQLVYYDQGTNQTHWWNVTEQAETRVVNYGSQNFALAPDGDTIAWGDRETSAIYLANTATDDEPTQILALPEELQIAPGITSLAFTSDGSKLIIGGLHARDEQNSLTIVDLSSQ